MAQTNVESSAQGPPDLFAVSSSCVVTPDGQRAAAIVVSGETIQDVIPLSELPTEGLPVQDFGDLIISPGIIDAHVHVNEPGRTEWEGFASATSAAAAGGITSLIDMPLNSSPVTTTALALREKQNAAMGKCHVDVGFYGGLVPGNVEQLPSLVESGVLGIKAFLCDSGLDEFPASSESVLRQALTKLKGSSVPLLVHAEVVLENLVPATQDPRSYSQFENSRPPEFELAAIELMIKLCREYHAPIHLVHLATSRALKMIEAAKAEGLPLSVETCPHYLMFSNQQIADGQTAYKCAPPIRSESNRQELCDAVTSGLIETIGSDHSPCLPELKLLETGDFSKAWGGIAGLQLTLPVTWTVGRNRGWTASLLAERLSHRPAEVFSVNGKGKIESGYDADLVVWDPNEEFEVKGTELLDRHPITPYEGRKLFGVVKHTFVRGQQVFNQGRLGKPRGKFLTRRQPSANEIANYLNSLSGSRLSAELERCCASRTWIARMIAGNKFKNDSELETRVRIAWNGLAESDYLESFSAHPRIGDVDTLREKFANTKQIAAGEQAGVDSADESVLAQLANANDRYFEKFGFIFIVCATGKTANQMLEIIQQRLPNDRQTEIENAATEQLKITLLRLRKLTKEIT